MSITGITAEYNPFHNGHKLHINEARRLSKTENLFVIMSGNFTQRGEPAIFDKYFRTMCALKNGADIVAELPCVFASSSAEFFASAAVKMFDDSGICSHIAFGAETEDISLLKKNAQILSDENSFFKESISQYLSEGLSFPAAREKALEKCGADISALSSPNNILALEYIKALINLKSEISPVAVKRVGNDYNQKAFSGALSSATAIRGKIFQNNIEDISGSVPIETYLGIKEKIKNGHMPLSFNSLSDILNYRLRMLSPEQLTQYHGISEGLENRIIASLKDNYSAYDIVSAIKSKRYTFSRLQRAMLHICLDIKETDLMKYKNNGYSPYIRVLGFRKDKKSLLKELTEKSRVPVITNIKNAHKQLDEYGMEILNKEITADNIYAILDKNKKNTALNQDFTTPLVIV